MTTTTKRYTWGITPLVLLVLALLALSVPALVPATKAATYVRIKNKWQGTYLYQDGTDVKYGSPAVTDLNSQWEIEDFGGAKRIKNRATGHYMHIQDWTKSVQISAVENTWESPKWTIADAPSAGYKVFTNVWHPWESMHIEHLSGKAECGGDWEGGNPANDSAQWLLETVVEPTATSTRTPTSAQAEDYVRIKNKWNSTYLYQDGTVVKYGSPAVSDQSSQWEIEDAGNGKHIRNRATGDYIHIQNWTSGPYPLEIGQIYDSWESAKWTFEDIANSSYKNIRSVWHGWEIINIENQTGKAEVGGDWQGGAPGNESAQWLLETVVEPTATPTETATNTALPTSTAVPASLLRNGSFENDANHDGKPDRWSAPQGVSRSSVVHHEGSFSIRHRATTNANFSSKQVVTSIHGGQSYSFSGWTNIPPTGDSFSYRIELIWRDGAGEVVRTDLVKTYTAATSGWDQATLSAKAPGRAASLVVRMRVASLNATIYSDDFTLTRLAPTATATATSTATPTPTVTLTPTPTATEAATATPSATATEDPSLVYARFKSKLNGQYLYESDSGVVKYGTQASTDTSSHWTIETFGANKRIKNRATGHYMNIEAQNGILEAGMVYDAWQSAQWTIETSGGSSVVRNVWHTWELIHIKDETGNAQYAGSVSSTIDAARWYIEEITSGGELLPTPTATRTNTPEASPTSMPPNQRGAVVPWVEYEAESASTNGGLLGPSRTFGTIASEASGRQAVELDATGEYVQFTTSAAANSIVVRYVIPDAPTGGGLTATLSLYVNDTFRQKLELTSKYAWGYGGEASHTNSPADGGAHHFFDEARALVADIPSGATVKLQKDGDDSAAYYVVDLVDLEQVAAPLTMPASGYLSLTEDCGATADDEADDRQALQDCIVEARTAGKGVWIPAGTFNFDSQAQTNMGMQVNNVTIRGAGMWYTVLRGYYARFHCVGSNCRFHDFAILGETTARDDNSPDNGFNGHAGSGSLLENIWVEHTKVGYWVGNGGTMTDGLIIRGSRFRNIIADGVNFCDGTSNSIVENTHVRGTGDDALAMWSKGSPNTNNIFRYNTVQSVWRANCYAIYGGTSNRIEDSLCADTVLYPGVMVAYEFDPTAFDGTTVVQRVTITRAGGPMWGANHGAIRLYAKNGPMHDILFKDIVIDSPTYAGISINGAQTYAPTVQFQNVQITSPGTYGIHVFRTSDQPSATNGSVTMTNVTVTSPGLSGLNNEDAQTFTLVDGGGNSGF